jgi:hypothetical protein
MPAPTRLLLAAALCLPSLAAAHNHQGDHDHDEPPREHGAHVHGVAWLDVALDGTWLEIGFKGTGADLAGIEGAPADAADLARIEAAKRTLADAAALFAFEPAGACRLDGPAMVEPPASALLAPGAAKDDHEHEHEHEHDHEHDHGDDKAHAHGDWTASYAFACTTPPVAMTLALFDRFADLTEVRAQVLTPTAQTAVEATPAQRRIALSGAP